MAKPKCSIDTIRMMGGYCGIDQGVSGAIAFIKTFPKSGLELLVYDMPTLIIGSGRKSKKTGKEGKKKILDFARIKKILSINRPSYTIVEKLQIAGRGTDKKFHQSAQSVATTAMNGGIILGMLFMAGFPYEEILASQWQKIFFKPTKGMDSKRLSYNAACKLFPSYSDEFIGERGGIKDGRADAALLALVAKRKYWGEDMI